MRRVDRFRVKQVDFLDLTGKGECYDVALESSTGERFTARVRAADPVAASIMSSHEFQRDTGIVTHALSAKLTDWEGLVDRHFEEQEEARRERE